MATILKRFTISVTPDMEIELDALKREKFYNTSQNEMIRYLINLGTGVMKSRSKNLRQEKNFTVTDGKRNGKPILG